MKSRAGLRLADLLAERDQHDEAIEILDEIGAIAAGAGTPGAIGVVQRYRGRVLGGAEGIAELTGAVERLGGSALALEHAWAQHDLGALLRREGRRADARDPLRAALDTADRLGAGRLAGLARDELLAAGARPQRTAVKGPEALTPSERRVAELAASGLSNREIAETLWVTRKTVELHLGSSYAKLGIRARTQLAEALAA
jgi:DNA-binding CsgD family transcriptional regulator